MNRIRRSLAFIVSALASAIIALTAFAPAALAAGTSANVSWTAPTQYTDSSTLPATDIASYTISWAPTSGQTGPSGSLSVTAPALTATVPVPCGNTTFTVTVTTTATAKYPSETSAPSSAVPYATGVTCGPKAVTGVTVS